MAFANAMCTELLAHSETPLSRRKPVRSADRVAVVAIATLPDGITGSAARSSECKVVDLHGGTYSNVHGKRKRRQCRERKEVSRCTAVDSYQE